MSELIRANHRDAVHDGAVRGEREPTIMQRLRSETRAHHDRIEAVIRLPRTPGEHQRILAGFYGFVLPWEERLEVTLLSGEADLAAFYEGRRKARLLAQDLRDTGRGDDVLPLCENLPDVSTPPRALGSMYVMEGATLGGQVIARHLEGELGMSAGRRYSYFRAYGRHTALMWNRFKALVSRHSSQAADDQIVLAAAETFDRLTEWMSEALRPTGPGCGDLVKKLSSRAVSAPEPD